MKSIVQRFQNLCATGVSPVLKRQPARHFSLAGRQWHSTGNGARTCALLAVTVWVAASASTPRVAACPFCNAAMQTLSQEIQSANVALIAQLAEPMPTSSDGTPGAQATAKFRVVDVLHGGDQLAGAKEINVVYFGDEAPDKKFLITGLSGVTGPGLDWTTPVPLSERAVDYVRHLPTVPADGAERLAFFQDYLENDDPLLAQDAYDEFARMPYAVVAQLGPRMNREQLLKWIGDAGVGPSSRRLYLTMLSICGQPADVGMLEELMNYDYVAMKPAIAAALAASTILAPAIGAGVLDEMIHAEEQRKRESLDALVACYLKLKGPAGLALINQLFLANPKVEFKHMHAALMALRFHGEETHILPREKLLESMRLALDHHDFADQVVPDLTRWEDWEIMPRLVAMFKEAPQDDYIRPPVASYLLVAEDAPGEAGDRARAAIKELEAIDPKTFDRARTNPAFSFLARAAASPASATGGAVATIPTNAARPAAPKTAPSPAPTAALDPPVPGVPETAAPETPPQPAVAADAVREVAAAKRASRPAPPIPVAATAMTPPSRIKMIGIPLVAAGVLLAIFAVLLRGADPRSSDETP